MKPGRGDRARRNRRRPSAARCRPWPPRPAIFRGCWSARRPCCRGSDCRRSCRLRSGSGIACSFGCKLNSFSATCRFRARLTSRCSAPKISVVSASTGGAADFGQQVGAMAQRGVGGDAGEGIRSAAVQSEDDLRGGNFGPPLGGGLFDEAARSGGRAASTVPRVPPLVCSVMPARRSLFGAFWPR